MTRVGDSLDTVESGVPTYTDTEGSPHSSDREKIERDMSSLRHCHIQTVLLTAVTLSFVLITAITLVATTGLIGTTEISPPVDTNTDSHFNNQRVAGGLPNWLPWIDTGAMYGFDKVTVVPRVIGARDEALTDVSHWRASLRWEKSNGKPLNSAEAHIFLGVYGASSVEDVPGVAMVGRRVFFETEELSKWLCFYTAEHCMSTRPLFTFYGNQWNVIDHNYIPGKSWSFFATREDTQASYVLVARRFRSFYFISAATLCEASTRQSNSCMFSGAREAYEMAWGIWSQLEEMDLHGDPTSPPAPHL
eukprot:GFYU01001399.1.p1 GENE.GFYU01001399.1~~GFYU01001399.1.p1  ORF type:complete len:305 (-),score=8.88 GFYU01001399.1:736-1650(-)